MSLLAGPYRVPDPEGFAPENEAEQLTWDLDWVNAGFRWKRRRVFRSLPNSLSAPIAAEYRRLWEGGRHGYRDANILLQDVREELNPRRLALATDEGELRAQAKLCADRCGALAFVSRQPFRALQAVTRYAQSVGVNLPALDQFRTVAGIVARLCDPVWWIGALRKLHLRSYEKWMRRLGQVSRRKGLYVSDGTLQSQRQRRRTNRRMLQRLEAVSEHGEVIGLDELHDRSVSNPRNRRNELMARIAGLEEVARMLGHVAEFYTLTCPSRFHAVRSRSGGRNPGFDHSTPRDAQAYLQTLWQRVRAKLHRRGLHPYGFRIAEPHHDGTPHWHFLLFMPAGAAEPVRETLRDYALREDSTETGAQEHRFKQVAIDPARGSAVGYVAKYISKNIDGFGFDPGAQEDGGMSAASTAERVLAFASTWGIRQFQQIGGPPVGVYRELRRLRDASSGDLERFRQAADSGDWAEFTQLMGGPTARRSARPIRIARQPEMPPSRYGDYAARRTIGLMHGNVLFPTRFKQWRVRKRKDKSLDDP